MGSVWEGVPFVQHPALTHDLRTDVLVIGGGAAGLLCANLLRENGVDCLVAEKDRVCSGVTRSTTAKITVQHGFLYDTLLHRDGFGRAQGYLRANEAAADQFEKLCGGIDCDYEIRDSVIYTMENRRAAEAEQRAIETIGGKSRFCEHTGLPFETAGAVCVPRQAQFHPLKFFSAISADLPILENTAVRALEGNTAVCDHGRIRAEKVIIATHFPFLRWRGAYFLKMYQYRSYVLALSGAEAVDAVYADEKDGGLSFRMAGDLLLLGGRGGKTGAKCGGLAALRDAAEALYPHAAERTAWATQDCMTLDSVPYIGRLSGRSRDVYTATGFGKWGMTGAMTAAMLLCDAVLGRRNPAAEVFDPSRSILHPQLVKNIGTAAANLLTFSAKRCPHLGCALKWNAAERTWDCSCHGSRFSEEGRVIDNPANRDLGR